MKNKLLIVLSLFPALVIGQLTGYWQSDVGHCYHIVQNGNEIFWASQSNSSELPYNVFHGALAGNTLTGIWNDLPSNPHRALGESLSLRIEGNNRMVKLSSSAAYYGNTWMKQNGPCKKKLQGHFQCDHIHTGCRTPNCPHLGQHLGFTLDFWPQPDGSITGKDSNGVSYRGTLSGNTFTYKFYYNNVYWGYGTYQFNADFSSFNGNFVDEKNGHQGTISGFKK